jgi:hypothetical protein
MKIFRRDILTVASDKFGDVRATVGSLSKVETIGLGCGWWGGVFLVGCEQMKVGKAD